MVNWFFSKVRDKVWFLRNLIKILYKISAAHLEGPWGRQQAHLLQKESSLFAVMWTGWQAKKAALDLRRQNRVIPRSREGKKKPDSCPVAF